MNILKKLCLIFVILFSAYQNFYSEVFVIAGIPEEPNRWINENGDLTGVDIEIISYIMEQMDVDYQIIIEDSSTRLEAKWKMKNSPYDMVFTYSQKDYRKEYLYYPEESHISFSWNFFILKENENKYKFEEFSDLKHARIGATKGFSYSDSFWQAAEDGLITLDTVVQNDLQITKLLNRRIDLVPLNTLATLYELKQDGNSEKVTYLKKPIKAKPYYNTFVKSSDHPEMERIRKQYDIILKEMKEDGTLDAILMKYYGRTYEEIK